MIHENEYYLSLDDNTTVYVYEVSDDTVYYELPEVDGVTLRECVSIWDFKDMYVLA